MTPETRRAIIDAAHADVQRRKAREQAARDVPTALWLVPWCLSIAALAISLIAVAQ